MNAGKGVNVGVNVTKQDLRNLRLNHKEHDEERICHCCHKKTKEVRSPSQNVSSLSQENNSHQDVNRYNEGPSSMEIVIGDVKTVRKRKYQKIYVTGSGENGRHHEKKYYRIETETRQVQYDASEWKELKLIKEPKRLLVDASVGSTHGYLNKTKRIKGCQTTYKGHIRYNKKNCNKRVGLGAESRKQLQVNQKLSPLNICPGTTSYQHLVTASVELNNATEVKGQPQSTGVEEVVYSSTFTLKRKRPNTDESKPTLECEAVDDSASMIAHRRHEESFTINKSLNQEKEDSSVKDIYEKLDFDLSDETKETHLIVGTKSSRRLLKTKLKEKRKETNKRISSVSSLSSVVSKESKPTNKSTSGSKLFLSMRRRFEALRRRRLGTKELFNNNELSPIIKCSSHDCPKFKDVSISSDPPSLIARPYLYRSQDISCNTARVRLKLWKKRNFHEPKRDKCRENVKAKGSQRKQAKKSKMKNDKREISASNKNAANLSGIITQNNITASRCDVKSEVKKMKMKGNDNLNATVTATPTADSDSWLDKFIVNNSDSSENEVIVRWDNNCHRRSSSSTILELMDYLYKDIGLDCVSRDVSRKLSQKAHNPYHQILPTYVIHSCEYEVPIVKETPITIKNSEDRNKSKKKQLLLTINKWIFERNPKKSLKTQMVLHAMYKKGSNFEFLRVDMPSGLLSGSITDRSNSKQSDERVYPVVNYDTPGSSKIAETFVKATDYEDFERQERNSSFELPDCSTVLKIVDWKSTSHIKPETSVLEEANTESIKNSILIDSVEDYGYHEYQECASQSYANAWQTDRNHSKSRLDANSKVCSNLLADAWQHIDNYIDNICDNTTYLKQSRKTVPTKRLKKTWQRLQRKTTMSDSIIGYCSRSWTSCPAIGHLQYETSQISAKGNYPQKPDHSQRIQSLYKVEIEKRGDNVEKIRKEKVTREAISPQSQKLISDDTIQKKVQYTTLASPDALSIVIQDPHFKLLLSSFDETSKKKPLTVSHLTQRSDLRKESISKQNTTLTKTQSQPTFPQEPPEKSFRIPKETQISAQICSQSSQSAPDQQKPPALGLRTNASCFNSNSEHNCQFLCKIKDHFKQHPSCTLKSVFGIAPCPSKSSKNKSVKKEVLSDCAERKRVTTEAICDNPDYSGDIPNYDMNSIINKSQSEDSVDHRSRAKESKRNAVKSYNSKPKSKAPKSHSKKKIVKKVSKCACPETSDRPLKGNNKCKDNENSKESSGDSLRHDHHHYINSDNSPRCAYPQIIIINGTPHNDILTRNKDSIDSPSPNSSEESSYISMKRYPSLIFLPCNASHSPVPSNKSKMSSKDRKSKDTLIPCSCTGARPKVRNPDLCHDKCTSKTSRSSSGRDTQYSVSALFILPNESSIKTPHLSVYPLRADPSIGHFNEICLPESNCFSTEYTSSKPAMARECDGAKDLTTDQNAQVEENEKSTTSPEVVLKQSAIHLKIEKRKIKHTPSKIPTVHRRPCVPSVLSESSKRENTTSYTVSITFTPTKEKKNPSTIEPSVQRRQITMSEAPKSSFVNTFQKITKGLPKPSPKREDTNLYDKQCMCPVTVPAIPKLTDFSYEVDQPSLATDCKHELTEFAPKSDDFDENVLQFAPNPRFGFNPEVIDYRRITTQAEHRCLPCFGHTRKGEITPSENNKTTKSSEAAKSGNKPSESAKFTINTNSTKDSSKSMKCNSVVPDAQETNSHNKDLPSCSCKNKNSSNESPSKARSKETAQSFQEQYNSNTSDSTKVSDSTKKSDSTKESNSTKKPNRNNDTSKHASDSGMTTENIEHQRSSIQPTNASSSKSRPEKTSQSMLEKSIQEKSCIEKLIFKLFGRRKKLNCSNVVSNDASCDNKLTTKNAQEQYISNNTSKETSQGSEQNSCSKKSDSSKKSDVSNAISRDVDCYSRVVTENVAQQCSTIKTSDKYTSKSRSEVTSQSSQQKLFRKRLDKSAFSNVSLKEASCESRITTTRNEQEQFPSHSNCKDTSKTTEGISSSKNTESSNNTSTTEGYAKRIETHNAGLQCSRHTDSSGHSLGSGLKSRSEEILRSTKQSCRENIDYNMKSLIYISAGSRTSILRWIRDVCPKNIKGSTKPQSQIQKTEADCLVRYDHTCMNDYWPCRIIIKETATSTNPKINKKELNDKGVESGAGSYSDKGKERNKNKKEKTSCSVEESKSQSQQSKNNNKNKRDACSCTCSVKGKKKNNSKKEQDMESSSSSCSLIEKRSDKKMNQKAEKYSSKDSKEQSKEVKENRQQKQLKDSDDKSAESGVCSSSGKGKENMNKYEKERTKKKKNIKDRENSSDKECAGFKKGEKAKNKKNKKDQNRESVSCSSSEQSKNNNKNKRDACSCTCSVKGKKNNNSKKEQDMESSSSSCSLIEKRSDKKMNQKAEKYSSKDSKEQSKEVKENRQQKQLKDSDDKSAESGVCSSSGKGKENMNKYEKERTKKKKNIRDRESSSDKECAGLKKGEKAKKKKKERNRESVLSSSSEETKNNYKNKRDACSCTCSVKGKKKNKSKKEQDVKSSSSSCSERCEKPKTVSEKSEKHNEKDHGIEKERSCLKNICKCDDMENGKDKAESKDLPKGICLKLPPAEAKLKSNNSLCSKKCIPRTTKIKVQCKISKEKQKKMEKYKTCSKNDLEQCSHDNSKFVNCGCQAVSEGTSKSGNKTKKQELACGDLKPTNKPEIQSTSINCNATLKDKKEGSSKKAENNESAFSVTRNKNNFKVRNCDGRVIVERRDYKANEKVEQSEGDDKSDKIEIRLTLSSSKNDLEQCSYDNSKIVNCGCQTVSEGTSESGNKKNKQEIACGDLKTTNKPEIQPRSINCNETVKDKKEGSSKKGENNESAISVTRNKAGNCQGRVIVERRDCKANEKVEESEGDDRSDKIIEIGFTLRIEQCDKTKESSIDNVGKNNKAIEMYPKTSKHDFIDYSHDKDKISLQNETKLSDVTVQITVKNISHEGNETSDDENISADQQHIVSTIVDVREAKGCPSFIPIKSGIKQYSTLPAIISDLKSTSSENRAITLVCKRQKDQPFVYDDLYDLKVKDSTSTPSVSKKRDKYTARRRIEDKTKKLYGKNDFQNEEMVKRNDNDQTIFVISSAEDTCSESMKIGLEPKELKNTDSKNNFYIMSTTTSETTPSSFQLDINEELPEWCSGISYRKNESWNRLKKCMCTSFARKFNLQEIEFPLRDEMRCYCKQQQVVEEITSCNLTSDNLTSKSDEEPFIINSLCNRITVSMTNKTGAYLKAKKNKWSMKKYKHKEKRAFELKSNTVLCKTTHYQELNNLGALKGTKTENVKTIHKSDVLQSNAMKKAVLEIYREKKTTKDEDLVANLPKFVDS